MNDSSRISLQDQYGPHRECFGCGAANEMGLQIKSFVEGDCLVASFMPAAHHHGFPGMLCGGIIGALFDCHMNWTAAWHLMQAAGSDELPCTVTGSFEVKFLAPTPMNQELRMIANVTNLGNRKAETAVTMYAGEVVTSKGSGVFIAVKEGHPALEHW